MSNLKYSRQRECIQNYLANSYEHPTADMVYMHVKNEFPNISLGTVYRNLNLLTDMGAALKINTPNGGHRFDGQLAPHNHFICKNCGTVVDLKMNEITEVDSLSGEIFCGKIEGHSTVFFGLCEDCITTN